MVESNLDAPEWILFETKDDFVITPSSPLCVQKSLVINKITLKSEEQGKMFFI
jgi:hypothetical protein